MRERSRSAVFACRLQVITQTDTHTLQIHTLKMTEDITFNFVTATKVNDLKDYYESWAALYLVVRALNLPLDGHESDSRQKWLALGWVTIFRRAIHLDNFTKPARPTQPSILHGMGNEYRPKCSDALQPRSKGRMAHSTCG